MASAATFLVLLTPSTRPLAPLTTSGPAARAENDGTIPVMLRLLCGGVWRRDELDARDAVSEGEVPSVGVVAVAEESADSGVWLRGSRGDAAGDGDDEEDDGEDEDEEEEEDDDDPALTESRNEQLLWLGQPSGVAGCGCGCSCGCLGSPLLIGGRGRGLCAGRTEKKKNGVSDTPFRGQGKGRKECR